MRKAVAVEIGLANPLNEPVEFEVRLTETAFSGRKFLYWEQKSLVHTNYCIHRFFRQKKWIDCICKSACRRGLVRAKINC